MHLDTIVGNKYPQAKFTLKGPSVSTEANREQDKRCVLSMLLLNMIFVATEKLNKKKKKEKSKSEKKIHCFCLDLI